MSTTNSTTNILEQNNPHFSGSIEMIDKEIEPEDKNRGSSDGLSRLLQNLQNGTHTVLRRNEERIRICTYVILNILFIAYFAWATYYFNEFSSDSLSSTTCTGYGLLMILFILTYFGVAYYLILKPYIIPLLSSRVSERHSKFFSNRIVTITFYVVIFAAFAIYLAFDTSDNRQRLVPLLGLFIFMVFGFLLCKHPGHIKWRPVLWGLILQFGFGLLTIRWDVGRHIFDCLGNRTTTFLHYASDGAAFVYGEFLVYREAVFAFQALSTIYFLGFIINILYYYGIMQKVIVTLGEFLQMVMGTTICESVNSAANIFLGMSEAPLLLKPYLEDLTVSEIHSMMTSGFATVSGTPIMRGGSRYYKFFTGTVLAAYISFGAEASHLITASVMSAPAALCYSKLTYPETEKISATKETIQILKSEYNSALDAASKGSAMALELVLGITANLIAFISLIYFLNGVLSWLGILVGYDGDSLWSIEKALGYVFMPVSFIMGVPWDESEMVGKLIGIKTAVNEFAAFKEMGKMVLRKRTKVIATYAICGFSNPGSIGIMISGLSVLMPKRRSAITSTVFRAFVAGEIVCFMTACIAALLIPENLL